MGFKEYLQKEKKALRKKYLWNKFYNYHHGLTLAQRTKLDSTPFEHIEKVCRGEEFIQNIYGNHYCHLASYSGKKINCPYLSKTPDKNRFYPCTYHQIPAFEIKNNKITLNEDPEFLNKIYDDMIEREIEGFYLNPDNIVYLKSKPRPKNNPYQNNNPFNIEDIIINDLMENKQGIPLKFAYINEDNSIKYF